VRGEDEKNRKDRVVYVKQTIFNKYLSIIFRHVLPNGWRRREAQDRARQRAQRGGAGLEIKLIFIFIFFFSSQQNGYKNDVICVKTLQSHENKLTIKNMYAWVQ